MASGHRVAEKGIPAVLFSARLRLLRARADLKFRRNPQAMFAAGPVFRDVSA